MTVADDDALDPKMQDAFAARLRAMLAELDRTDADTAADRAPVELDQQSVGRLSRMDALQVQAMANAQARRRAVERQRIRAALARIPEDEYGWCTGCGEPVGRRRLELDPAAAQCVSCAGG